MVEIITFPTTCTQLLFTNSRSWKFRYEIIYRVQSPTCYSIHPPLRFRQNVISPVNSSAHRPRIERFDWTIAWNETERYFYFSILLSFPPFRPPTTLFFRETWREMGGFQDTMYINLNLWHGESLARLLSEIVIPFLRANSPRKIPRPTNLCSLVIWHEAGEEGFAKRTRGTEIEIFSKLGFRLDNFRCLPLRAAHCAPLWFFSRFRWKGGGRGSRSFSIVFNLSRVSLGYY